MVVILSVGHASLCFCKIVTLLYQISIRALVENLLLKNCICAMGVFMLKTYKIYQCHLETLNKYSPYIGVEVGSKGKVGNRAVTTIEEEESVVVMYWNHSWFRSPEETCKNSGLFHIFHVDTNTSKAKGDVELILEI